MPLSRAGRLARLLILAALATLVVPGIAQAHHTAVPVVALDYRNRILPGSSGPAGVHASVEDAGRKLRLTVAAQQEARLHEQGLRRVGALEIEQIRRVRGGRPRGSVLHEDHRGPAIPGYHAGRSCAWFGQAREFITGRVP